MRRSDVFILMATGQTSLQSDEAGWCAHAVVLMTVFTPVDASIFVGKIIDNQGAIWHNIYFWTTGIIVFYPILILKVELYIFTVVILLVKPFERV